MIQFPSPHRAQSIFVDWCELNPEAQVLVAPCGTKIGKSFGSSLWLAREAAEHPNLYCIWIAPTYMKAKIGYRYICNLLNIPTVDCKDGRLEIFLGNGSTIKFIHGHDPEVAIEGEAVDRFVVDESGKQKQQLWFSLFTTLTQTGGKGIVTGTPRGFNWYAELFQKAKSGDPFFCWAQLATAESPFVRPETVENARRLLPFMLFAQYYLAQFVSSSGVFGDIQGIWDDSLIVDPKVSAWFHPDEAERAKDSCTGVDWAKVNDWTVFYTVNCEGKTIGYCRFRGGSYPAQVKRLKRFISKFKGDRSIRYDKTGVGQAIEDIINEHELDASVTGVTFTNASKQEMVTRTTIAIQEDWLTAPKIERLETEMVAYEVTATRSGLHSYAAPEGEHDDVVSAMILGVSGAFESSKADRSDRILEETRASIDRESRDRMRSPHQTADDYAEEATKDLVDDALDDIDDDFLDLNGDGDFDGPLED